MSSVVISGDTSGAITLSAPAVAGTNTITLPANTGTVLTTASTYGGTGPAFSAYQSSVQTLTANTFTKITFTTEEFDTNSNFASSRFTPTVAGYYQVNGAVAAGATLNNVIVDIYKNGSSFKQSPTGATQGSNQICAIVYLNGTTDYIEIYCSFSIGQTTYATSQNTYFQAAMVRNA
jgi:hypothetical protein